MPRKRKEEETFRVLIPGRPDNERCDNKVVSARYNLLNFFPKSIFEQFRRFANLYFLGVGTIMFLGTYTPLFQSAISPWTTLGPLAIVVSISMLVEGSSDYKRHLNDAEVNNTECVVLTRADTMENEAQRDPHICGGRDVLVNINKAYYSIATSTRDSTTTSSSVRGNRERTTSSDPNDPSQSLVNIAFQKVKRKDIRQGEFVLVKNREMVPADLLLLASSNDQGGAYIETSSIDGETNLKLRTSPHLPKAVLKALRESTLGTIGEGGDESSESEQTKVKHQPEIETMSAAVKRLTRFSALGRPNAFSSLEHPSRQDASSGAAVEDGTDRGMGSSTSKLWSFRNKDNTKYDDDDEEGKYIASLTTEAPNASVHTFTGTLTLPPFGDASSCQDIPLGADNVLLRGAMIRNTEWVIGLAFFTGAETKLVQNSFETPSKFSQLDRLMNKTVAFILLLMILIMSYLAAAAVIENQRRFDELFYIGYNRNLTEPWPFFAGLEDVNLEPPTYVTRTDNWLQFFFLFITLVSNMIPLSLYVTIEGIQFFMLWLIYKDKELYDDTTDTQAQARSTNVSDLGRIQYIFSDKTGTLTQNVMRFKRCSVDGMAFGGPIQRMRPRQEGDEEEGHARFHPIRQLLVGRFKKTPAASSGLEGFGETTSVGNTLEKDDDKLTFHSEMFLRVMSLCHTVVVEKDIDNKEQINSGMSVSSHGSSVHGSLNSMMSRMKALTLKPVSEGAVMTDIQKVTETAGNRDRTDSVSSMVPTKDMKNAKASDGAPYGFAYQAESPDEGALVSAASSMFGFQVVARDSNGICLRCPGVSHFQDESVTDGLRSKTLSLDRLAAMSVGDVPSLDPKAAEDTKLPAMTQISTTDSREEVWTILAVNKFDSDRKRMSILLRSPPELGNLPILFCKGADSAMLADDVCCGGALFSEKSILNNTIDLSTVSEAEDGIDENGYKVNSLLGMQMHLGEFAKEGLRTLVLGMKVLTEEECSDWMALYQAAATSIKDREALLSAAAKSIERDIHIVGATAIEDKLQDKVPETIATLEKAGIKLWVLTGDKRETAVEIGYSTNVLTSKMHLTQVPDNGRDHVRTQIAMEFIRLVKHGRLPLYQKEAFTSTPPGGTRQKLKRLYAEASFRLRKVYRLVALVFMKWTVRAMQKFRLPDLADERSEKLAEMENTEKRAMRDIERRKRVRNRADSAIRKWIAASRRNEQQNVVNDDTVDDDLSLASDDLPAVFKNADSARNLLNGLKESGEFRASEKRELSVALLTAEQSEVSVRGTGPVDEDLISLQSFLPHNQNEFDRTKRTLLERLFAVDRDVRKGRLQKHMTDDRLDEITSEDYATPKTVTAADQLSGPRALVIEGSSLKYLLGNPEFEEMLFAVASSCNAVIACRVSPRQKAELVALVRRNISPEPITLAIGDGANDVGMIQEAHVGVGISGKEGTQAVNASDFSIAQFRFLETLVLIHGRWNFFRLSTVVLFSFYKNACMAGVIVLFGGHTVYSGTAVFDEWIVAMLNFVAAFPIIFLGMFDRCLSKDYVRRYPEVYRATRENELITLRTLVRWVAICLLHVFIVYYFTIPQQSYGGGVNPGFLGLMRNGNPEAPGDGEGGDLKSVGTVTYTTMIIVFGYKVLFESRSLVHGMWPAFACPKGKGEGFFSRLAYSWVGVTYLSIGFYLWAITIYSIIGRGGASDFSSFTDVAMHVLGTRSLTWMLIVFVPIFAIIADVVLKVFSNLFYPTQTQIHLEMESEEKRHRKWRERQLRRNPGRAQPPSSSTRHFIRTPSSISV